MRREGKNWTEDEEVKGTYISDGRGRSSLVFSLRCQRSRSWTQDQGQGDIFRPPLLAMCVGAFRSSLRNNSSEVEIKK